MADSDLHPTRTAGPGAPLAKKPITLTPETKIVVQLGGLAVAAGFLIWLGITGYKIQANGEEALRRLDRLEPIIEQHKRLWWEYEGRTTSRGAAPRASL